MTWVPIHQVFDTRDASEQCRLSDGRRPSDVGTATAEGLPYYDFGLVCTLDTHYPGPVYAVAWSRDGRLSTFDTFRSGVRHVLEWRSKDGRSLCRTVDRAEIQRLMEEARRGANILNS